MILLLAVPENNNENSNKLLKNVKVWSHFLADFPCHGKLGMVLVEYYLPSHYHRSNQMATFDFNIVSAHTFIFRIKGSFSP